MTKMEYSCTRLVHFKSKVKSTFCIIEFYVLFPLKYYNNYSYYIDTDTNLIIISYYFIIMLHHQKLILYKYGFKLDTTFDPSTILHFTRCQK